MRKRLSWRAATDGLQQNQVLVFYLHPEMTRLAEMIRLLTAHGADLNALDGKRQTILDRADVRGWIDFANVLGAHGARTAVD